MFNGARSMATVLGTGAGYYGIIRKGTFKRRSMAEESGEPSDGMTQPSREKPLRARPLPLLLGFLFLLIGSLPWLSTLLPQWGTMLWQWGKILWQWCLGSWQRVLFLSLLLLGFLLLLRGFWPFLSMVLPQWGKKLSQKCKAAWRWCKEWMGRLPLFVTIAIWVVLAAVLLTVLVKWWGGWPVTSPVSGASVGGASKARAGTNQNSGAFEAVKSALTAVAGIGGVAYLVIKYRTEQRETAGIADKKISVAVDQLGSDKASTRIAGVYALTDIADNYGGGYRQRVVDILCGYLRSDRETYPLGADGKPATDQPMSGDADKAVESTILSVMRDHLRRECTDDETGETIVQTVDDDRLWCDCAFDLHGATFHEVVDLRYSTFERDADFRGTKFERVADFRGADFTGRAYFGGAVFTGSADFRGARFTGRAYFVGAVFTGGAYFVGARFTGKAYFGGAAFTGGAYFVEAVFTGSAYFGWAVFTGGARFVGARFTDRAYFGWAVFAGGAYFDRADLTGEADFRGAEFRGVAYFSEIQGQPSFGFEACKFNRKFRGIDAYGFGPIPLPKDNDGLPAGAVWADFPEEDDKDGGTTNR